MLNTQSTCLIVDDEELVCRGILREFKRRFNRVYYATRPDDAEKILQHSNITNLVCDYYLGETVPRGTELLAKWRQTYPNIERAVIFTGTDPAQITGSKWVDSTLSKSLPLDELYNAVVAPREENKSKVSA